MIRPTGSRQLLVLVVLAMPGWGCTGGPLNPGGALEFRVINGAFRTFPEKAVEVISPLYDPRSDEIRLAIAGRETAGFFLELRAPQTLDRVTLVADALTSERGTLDVAAVEFYGVQSVETGAPPGWHIKAVEPQRRRERVPDLLIPARAPKHGQPYRLSAGEPLYLWTDVTVPAGTRPGHYFATIRVFQSSRPLAQIPVKVEVLPFDLPDVSDVALLTPVRLAELLSNHLSLNGRPFEPQRLLRDGPLFEESLSLLQRTFGELRRHRISPFLTGCYPITELDQRGELTIKWQDYDAIVSALLEPSDAGSPAIPTWLLPFDAGFPSPPSYDPLTSAAYTRTVRQYLVQCVEHFRTRGWMDRATVAIPVQPADFAEAVQRSRGFAELLRLSSGDAAVLAQLAPQDLRPYGWSNYPHADLSDYVDIWAPPAQFFDPTVFAQTRYRRQRPWLSLDRPPYSGSIDPIADDTFVRVIPWQARRLGAAAVLLPAANDWIPTQSGAAAEIARQRSALLAPGTVCGLDEPIPTLRLKMLRQGMQDLAYMQLCRRAGRQDVADAVLRSLCRYAGTGACGAHLSDGRFDGWERRPMWWNHARELMVATLHPTDGRAAASFQSTEWQRFFEATTAVEVEVHGTRINLPEGERGPFEVEVLATVRNHTPETCSGTLAFGELPLGWEASGGPQPIGHLPPSGKATIKLRARAENMPVGENGKTHLPLSLKLRDRPQAIAHRAVLAHLSVARLSRPLKLDGDPSDWPPAVGNTATQFTGISADPASETVVAADGAGATVGFVATDHKYLYMLFHCTTSGPVERGDLQSNLVVYEDGIPVGEELLEILLDPTNAGTTTPGDLFHIVIKPSGSVIKERGIRAEPQIGYTEAWPADVQVVTRRERKKWIAEVRIPLKDFGNVRVSRRSWGVNFCRFEASRNHYANWAGARWNPYKPIALGNMTFPD